MRVPASDLIVFHRPSPCGLRIYLRERGEPEDQPSPYEMVLRRLGIRHEEQHLATLGPYIDVRNYPEAERAQRTVELLKEKTPVLYQGKFEADVEVEGAIANVVGEPDFLILADGNYIIRDSKISRRIDEENHPEILLQVQLYGWLFEKAMLQSPRALQVHGGKGEILDIAYDGGKAALSALAELLQFKLLAAEPYEPVGWTKCTGCGYRRRCWDAAVARGDVALVPDVDQGLARALYENGVRTRRQLLQKFDSATLSEFRRPRGKGMQKVGKKAERILLAAELMETGREKLLKRPAIPNSANYAMFDLEGLPPHLNELEKIYLWGMQVFGERPSRFMAATADFGPEGDEAGWLEFLRLAKQVLDTYGDIPFVHWSSYEKTYVTKYVDRFGDPDGIAKRVLGNLLDLLLITKDAIALPIPSYSLKVIEEYVGYQRTQAAYGGDWAMATFIEATETSDVAKRNALVQQILDYNREDLEATWAVFQWLRAKTAVVAGATSF